MKKTTEKLKAYRKCNAKEIPCSSMLMSNAHEGNSDVQHSPGILQWLNIDVLDAPPFCTWRRCYESRPWTTIVISWLLYLIGQIYFIWIQFGLVFFVVSVLLAICLSLGNRREGEVSAYSVFNPNCERLLGQMTAEHFERDVLRRTH